MSEKREAPETVYGAVLQVPCDMARARLPESQSPAVQPHTRRYNGYNAASSEIRSHDFHDRKPLPDER